MNPTHKKCRSCEEWKELKHFHKQGKYKGKQQYRAECKVCYSARMNGKWSQKHDQSKGRDFRNKYNRARSRALSRLAYVVPHLYLPLLREELKKEGVDQKRIDQFAQNTRAYQESKAV